MKHWYALLRSLLFAAVTTNLPAQAVVITDVKIINRVFVRPKTFQYKPGDSLIRTDYRYNNAIVYFRSPLPKAAYTYRIRQLFAKTITTQDSFAVLPNLPNGEYHFEVRDTRQRDSQYTRLYFVVESPLWLRWWFLPLMFLYGLLFVSAGLYLLYRYRLRQFLRLQQTRDRIARDLHDDMGSYLSSISILSQTAHRSATKDPAKTQATLDRIGQTARQVMDSMGDIVWSINPDHDSMPKVIARMTDVAASLFADTGIDWQVTIAGGLEQLRLSAEYRRDFFLIYKEAVTNVARYAQASRVRVGLHREGNTVVMQVQDDGCGFDVANPARQNLSGGNGLRNMNNRAALLRGTLTIDSNRDTGTTVSLRFPV